MLDNPSARKVSDSCTTREGHPQMSPVVGQAPACNEAPYAGPFAMFTDVMKRKSQTESFVDGIEHTNIHTKKLGECSKCSAKKGSLKQTKSRANDASSSSFNERV